MTQQPAFHERPFRRALLLLPLLHWACGTSHDDAADSQDPLTTEFETERGQVAFSLSCGQTWEQACLECESEHDAEVRDCLQLCRDFTDFQGYSTCYSACERLSLSDRCQTPCDELDGCREYRFGFSATGPVDSDVLTGCQDAVARDERCEEVTIVASCERFSEVELPASAGVYACLAAAPCGEPDATCSEALGESDLGEELRASCTAVPLDDVRVTTLSHLGRWTRPEVQAGVHVCAERYCVPGGFAPCIDAWIEFVLGSE